MIKHASLLEAFIERALVFASAITGTLQLGRNNIRLNDKRKYECGKNQIIMLQIICDL